MNKTSRILTLFVRLLNGDIVNKKDLSKSASIGEKSIQRDINDINLSLIHISEPTRPY